MTAGKATMGREVGKRMRERLTIEVSRPQYAGRLERQVRARHGIQPKWFLQGGVQRLFQVHPQ